MIFRKPRAAISTDTSATPVKAVDPARAFGPTALARVVDLVPIPAALIEHSEGSFHFMGVNRPFRRAGLGMSATESPIIRLLGARILAFLESPATQQEFDWQVGEEIDARHFHVMLARRPEMRGQPRCLMTLVDQTGERRTETSLRREMLSDSLTGLPNRGGFGDVVEGSITRENAHAYAVMIVNMDRFARVNACMGSLAGDELLISVARRLRGALRARDTLARIGGDEFGVLVAADEGEADAMHVAARIRAALATPFRLSDFEIRVECSIGVALGGDEISEPEDLIRHAQFAVKRAKKTGKAEVYNHSTFDIVRTQFGIETRLRHAIDNGDLRLTFQPICDLASGRIVSFETLARWSPDGREVSPVDFIPVAEESGLIVPLGRWAMDEAARTIAAWDAQAGGRCGANLSINLSAIQLQRDQVAPMVRAAIEAYGIEGERLTLELTESAIVSDPDRIAATMQALKGLGTTLAMDDFGTGYSNLAYLQKLPIDVLKIDRSFVSGMLADRDKVAIVRAILSLAQALGMRTTAEGIETNELAQTLAALGCTYGQGYLYARPLERDDAYAMLARESA
ncbi:putative bifunctional diguanylate cyclase/phosphodiesterase [Sphingomonas sp.]|uniref:putative bifunctional diguanylate cyclase/phosphodiesterase n=1 Tax=Sphingomonas sp. TaxID=28214 RepID=UPI002DD668CD|nr:bifunctional diguanylate cyclase/phosphodiesterase [Sphingomonas sp.]